MVDIDSMKQAARRPSPPLPSAASGSFSSPLRRQAEIADRLAADVEKAEVDDGVLQQPANKEFHRQVIDALARAGIGGTGAGEPRVGDAVADGECEGDAPVIERGMCGILAQRILQVSQNAVAKVGGGHDLSSSLAGARLASRASGSPAQGPGSGYFLPGRVTQGLSAMLCRNAAFAQSSGGQRCRQKRRQVPARQPKP